MASRQRVLGARKRKRGVAMLENDVPPVEVARRCRVSDTAVYRWRKTVLAKGLEGIRRHKPTGRPPRLTREQLARLAHAIRYEKPKDHEISGESWQRRQVQALIFKLFGVSYRLGYCIEIVRSLGIRNLSTWELKKLTHRQGQIVELLPLKTPEEIAKALSIKLGNVKRFIFDIVRRFGFNDLDAFVAKLKTTHWFLDRKKALH